MMNNSILVALMNADDLPISLKEKLNEEAQSKGVKVSSLITSILADYFNLKMHTVFQISTTGALVAGNRKRNDGRDASKTREFWVGHFY